MSDKGNRREWLLKHVDYVFAECRGYIESKNNDCLNCLKGADVCYQAYEEIKRLTQQKESLMSIEEALALVVSILEDREAIQQKLEIDEKKYVDKKAWELSGMNLFFCVENSEDYAITVEKARKFITQIISDAKGREKSEVAEWISGDKYW